MRSGQFPSTSNQSGFTLIELLITVAIIILIFGGGVTAYLNLDRRQSLINVCKEVEQMARSAQKKARVGDRPVGCDHLTDYRLSRTSTGPDVISLQAICDNGMTTVQTYNVPTIFTVQSLTTMNFRVLHGGLMENQGLINVTSSSPNYRCQFDVDNGGSIGSTTVSQY